MRAAGPAVAFLALCLCAAPALAQEPTPTPVSHRYEAPVSHARAASVDGVPAVRWNVTCDACATWLTLAEGGTLLAEGPLLQGRGERATTIHGAGPGTYGATIACMAWRCTGATLDVVVAPGEAGIRVEGERADWTVACARVCSSRLVAEEGAATDWQRGNGTFGAAVPGPGARLECIALDAPCEAAVASPGPAGSSEASAPGAAAFATTLALTGLAASRPRKPRPQAMV